MIFILVYRTKESSQSDFSTELGGCIHFAQHNHAYQIQVTSLRSSLNTWAQFHRTAKHKNLLSMKFLSWLKQDYQPNFHLLHFACYWYSANMANACLSWKFMEIWLVILFLPRQNFHGKQILGYFYDLWLVMLLIVVMYLAQENLFFCFCLEAALCLAQVLLQNVHILINA